MRTWANALIALHLDAGWTFGFDNAKTRAGLCNYTTKRISVSRHLAARYEDLASCPDVYLLFFHLVPYGHVLHSGSTVIQHIYDGHFAGVEAVEAMRGEWEAIRDRFPADVVPQVDARLAEQHRSAIEWRDQINTYFWRKSGVPDAHGRAIHP